MEAKICLIQFSIGQTRPLAAVSSFPQSESWSKPFPSPISHKSAHGESDFFCKNGKKCVLIIFYFFICQIPNEKGTKKNNFCAWVIWTTRISNSMILELSSKISRIFLKWVLNMSRTLSLILQLRCFQRLHPISDNLSVFARKQPLRVPFGSFVSQTTRVLTDSQKGRNKYPVFMAWV